MATKIVTKNSSTASAVPTASDLVQGELAVNVADKRLFTEDNAGAIVELGTNPSGNVTFQDNGKAIFGAGSDLQIYHDGTHSYVDDSSGTGRLIFKTDYLEVQNAAGNEAILGGIQDGAVSLFYDGNTKLATTSTGIDVTGIASVTGSNQHALTIKSDVGTGSYEVGRNQSTGLLEFKGTEATYNGYLFKGPSSDLMTINASGNVGIGTSSPNVVLQAVDASGTAVIALDDSRSNVGDTASVEFRHNGITGSLVKSSAIEDFSVSANRSSDLQFWTRNNGTQIQAATISSDGNVGIGTSSPNVTGYDSNATVQTITGPLRGILELQGSSSAADVMGAINFYSAANLEAAIQSRADSGTFNGNLEFITNGSERMRIDSSGNLLVGKTTQGLTNAGFEVAQTGQASATQSGASCLRLNRLSSDGEILQFRKDGTTVGSIGTSTGGLYIADAGVGFRFDSGGTDDIIPCSASGAAADASINLGSSGARFKDLYLSGTANLNFINHSETIYPTTDAAVDIGTSSERYRNLYLSGNAYVGGVYPTGIYNQQSGDIQFWVPNVGEAVRIQQNTGNLLVGTTTAQGTITVAENKASSFVGHFKNSNGSAYGLGIDTGSGSQIFFYLSGANKGSIISNSSGTAYNTTSDQRLKENIADADDAGSKIDAIQVRKFDWKADGSHQDYGMIAQELQTVAPEAVSGDADSEEMMGVDYSKLVPMMLKEIQSLRNRVAQLEG